MKKLIYISALVGAVIGVSAYLFFSSRQDLEESNALRGQAEQFCNDENVARVAVSATMIQRVSKLAGGGATYVRADGTEFKCPVVAPNSQSQECKDVPTGGWKTICEK